MAKPHAVVVPYPSSGNINPALQLAKLLHRHGLYITFVNTELNHRRVQATEGAAAVLGRDGFRFEAILDGLTEADRDSGNYDLALAVATTTRCAEPLRELVLRLNATPGVPPVTCLVPTALMSFALDVARELGIPSMVLWGCSAAALTGQMRLRELQERGYLPLKDESCLKNGHLDRTVIDWIPACHRSASATSPASSAPPTHDFGLRFNRVEVEGCTKAGALILNTFDNLEGDVLNALRADYPRIYTIGPLGNQLRDGNAAAAEDNFDSSDGGLSLWKQDPECLTWLDTQEENYVVYANFGSLTVLTAHQLAEFAWGLAASGHPFLWSIRDNLVPGEGAGLALLPPEFVAATAGRCCLTTWCPQEQVLRHPSVGCFLTHNGWNSTYESVAAGVPMVCWPGFADQYINCKYACEVWGIGLRLDDEVRREQVAGHVRQAMETEEMRRSAVGWKAKAEDAAARGGSSYENLQSMVTALFR